MPGYLFVHFTGEHKDGEQVYFSISQDGQHWHDMNGSQPVLYSDIGDKGVRDPFIVRHPITGRYYLIATDLCMHIRKDWDSAVRDGSRDIIIWESDDILHWSAPRSATIAPEGAGCAWAPEAIWDETKDAFLLFFASFVKENEDSEGRHRIYSVHTKDFLQFTFPQKYIERMKSVIDTTIIHDGGIYYRFSKDETSKQIILDKGSDLAGMFESVHSDRLASLLGLEGPECYLLPDGKWCLICDQFASGKGYLPIVIDDLDSGKMHVLSDKDYDFGESKKRHGGVIQITDGDYERLTQISNNKP